ncbi:hypothetical protein BKH41_00705 [Helicobacter sp. 12S02232-10]|uniref:hypothetical protein n=1 Tax=Helicobacter sp. 12S02232-10 TaxID=1476197 RepID=UPI000BA6B6E5|nr:hypothetical protein [Helicobacter sp. 12S02232-10]PAF49855.1 hypothetical protein BKH41_00705 [Helicobacter sp. 12S02232-10]
MGSGGRGGDNTNSTTNNNYNFSQALTGNNLSNFLNLGTFTYGNHNVSTPSLSNSNYSSLGTSNKSDNDNTQKSDTGSGGAGGGFSAALDFAASAAITGEGDAKSGDATKEGGGATYTPPPKNNQQLLIFGGLAVGSLVLFNLLNKKR